MNETTPGQTRVQARARARANELPGAECSYPFGEQVDVFKVCGKMFMMHTEMPGQPVVVLKVTPEEGRVLQLAYESITPGYHMNKKHWITLGPGDELSDQLIDDLVTESYLLVVEKLPARLWPVDPETFGQGPGIRG